MRGGSFQADEYQAIVCQQVGCDVQGDHLGGEEHGEILARCVPAAAEELVECCGDGAGRAEEMERFVGFDG